MADQSPEDEVPQQEENDGNMGQPSNKEITKRKTFFGYGGRPSEAAVAENISDDGESLASTKDNSSMYWEMCIHGYKTKRKAPVPVASTPPNPDLATQDSSIIPWPQPTTSSASQRWRIEQMRR
jgi:hypothetical protein